ncbi:hypothetical protein [Pyrobaculum neutrophilum]|uniref:Uncharacterized protein n=1 Tax=Pyrobaculum neutrophilum (strain DSM 2338 / JCM 9278 / NBRC 100436 / V24Sta) TaxID=444157 RepID=B1YA12_PYRNV|nr:hypothetical protein [Pyrobaculum neutrophilum]ACB40562.1 conserved hypothetical protein [Pyrobaculum neutrophilum V24Sta]
MSTSLLGIAREGEDYVVLNITEGYKARLVRWFKELEDRLAASLKTGTSVVLLGPHGSGKSVFARYIAARFVGEYYAVIDLGVDVASFDSMLEMLSEVPGALGFHDPLGISFYDSPLVPRHELAAAWIKRCRYIVERALYLASRDVPTLLVLPYSLFRHSPCSEIVERNMKVIDLAEYLRHVDVRQALREVFSAHAAALGCRKSNPGPYVDYLLEKHGDFSGVFALAAYGGRIHAGERCASYRPEELYHRALEALSKLYYGLYREAFFPTCREAKLVAAPLKLSLRGQHIPPELAFPLANVEKISRRLRILGRISQLDDVTREEVVEELSELYQPQEEARYAVEWASAPKESVVVEALTREMAGDPCMQTQGDAVQALRTVYRGLMALRPEYVFDFAKYTGLIALGDYSVCGGELGRYLCYGGGVPPAVVEALGNSTGRRLAMEGLLTAPIPRCEEEGAELLARLALIDARRAPARCLEKFAEVLRSAVLRRREALGVFYKLYGDYVHITAERGTPPALRALAIAHYLGDAPQDALSVLMQIARREDDYKATAAAVAKLAALDANEALALLPNCDCPFLKVYAGYVVAKSLAEAGRRQEALNVLDFVVSEVRRGDPRHEYTPQFLQEIEELYKQVALETLTEPP